MVRRRRVVEGARGGSYQSRQQQTTALVRWRRGPPRELTRLVVAGRRAHEIQCVSRIGTVPTTLFPDSDEI